MFYKTETNIFKNHLYYALLDGYRHIIFLRSPVLQKSLLTCFLWGFYIFSSLEGFFFFVTEYLLASLCPITLFFFFNLFACFINNWINSIELFGKEMSYLLPLILTRYNSRHKILTQLVFFFPPGNEYLFGITASFPEFFNLGAAIFLVLPKSLGMANS